MVTAIFTFTRYLVLSRSASPASQHLAVNQSGSRCERSRTRSVVAVLLCASLTLLSESRVNAQSPNSSIISSYIQQLSSLNQRTAAINALRQQGQPAVDALVRIVENPRQPSSSRLLAIYALGEVGSTSQTGIVTLIVALQDSDRQIRLSAIRALGRIGVPAKTAVPDLARTLTDPDEEVRSVTAYTLSLIGSDAKAAIPALIEALQDPQSAQVRLSAANALGRMSTEADLSVPALIIALKDPNEGVRLSAANALGQLGEGAKLAVPALIEVVEKDNKNVCSFAASALGRIGATAQDAIPTLIKALQHHDRDVRLNAAVALGRMGSAARVALPALVSVLEDTDVGVRLSSASTLGKIAGSLQDEAKKLSTADLDQALSNLEQALKALENPAAQANDEVLAAVRRSLNALKTEQESRLLERTMNWVQKNPLVAGPLTYLASIVVLWSMLLWLRPLWLLRINELLKFSDLSLPLPAGNITVSARLLLLLNLFNYHPRVLDAWVTSHLDSVREGFQKKTTVSDRQVHISLPVVLDGNLTTELTGKELHSAFAKRRGCLMIWGEGGSGKTSLACQLAKWAMTGKRKRGTDLVRHRLCDHPMLPVLIEHELNFQLADGKKPFIEAIRGQLQALIGQADPIADELLDRLLRQRRILVIVDHFSEMGDATRKEIRPGHPDFPANALIVTSRIEETLDGVPKTTLFPLRIDSDRISSFMEAYLVHRGKRLLFDDLDFFDICRRLSIMVGHRHVTVLLAKLYAEQVIATQEGRMTDGLPNSIPNLMLSYLNELNRSTVDGETNHASVHRDAGAIAWECLKQTYRPAPIKRETALTALNQGDDAEAHLKHLEKRLRILQTVGPAQDQICFALDPLAEYLAGWHLVEIYGSDSEAWMQWFAEADAVSDSPRNIQGFLLAVRDCCLARGTLAKTPEFVIDELEQRLGITPQPIAYAQPESTHPPIVAQLTSVSQEQDGTIRELVETSMAAKLAIPNLLVALKVRKLLERSTRPDPGE